MARGARCDLCPLKGRPVIPPTPAASPRLVIVGEMPSKHDEEAGALLTSGSQSGRLLDGALRENGIKNRTEIHVTTAALCRGETDKDNWQAALCCASRLLGELADINSRGNGASAPILTLGKSATHSVLGTKKLLYARGFVWHAAEIEPAAIRAAKKKAEKGKVAAILAAEHLEGRALLAGRVVFPTLAPGFILKAETWTPVWRIDLRRALRWAFIGPSSLEDAGALRVGGLEVLEGLGAIVSLDIETDGVKPLECNILCVGVADSSGQAAVIYPWRRRLASGLGQWLRTCKQVVAHNGRAFDEIVLANHGVK